MKSLGNAPAFGLRQPSGAFDRSIQTDKNLGWTTGGDGGNVRRVTGISRAEMRETGGEQPQL